MATLTNDDSSIASATASAHAHAHSHEHELHEMSIVDRVARALVSRHLTDKEADSLYDGGTPDTMRRDAID